MTKQELKKEYMKAQFPTLMMLAILTIVISLLILVHNDSPDMPSSRDIESALDGYPSPIKGSLVEEFIQKWHGQGVWMKIINPGQVDICIDFNHDTYLYDKGNCNVIYQDETDSKGSRIMVTSEQLFASLTKDNPELPYVKIHSNNMYTVYKIKQDTFLTGVVFVKKQ